MKMKPRIFHRLYWLHRRILSALFRSLLLTRQEPVVAFIMAVYTRLYTLYATRNIRPRENKIRRVLGFNREVFCRDLAELHRRTDLSILFSPMSLYGSLFHAFHPVYMKDQLCYYAFNSSSEMQCKQGFRDACERILPHLRKRLRFDAIISANIDYPYDQGFVDAARKHQIPFVALVKEGVQSNAHYQWWINHFRNLSYRFNGAGMTVFCKRRKETLILSGVADEKDITVVGAPRSDLLYDELYRNRSIQKSEKPCAVLFTFSYALSRRTALWRETLMAFAKAARTMSGKNVADFIIKARFGADRQEVEWVLAEAGLLSHVIVDTDISFAELGRRSILAVGYNTTAIVEMMATDVPVIIPHFGEAPGDPDYNMLDSKPPGSAYFVTETPAELQKLIEESVSGDLAVLNAFDFRKGRDLVIEKFIHRIDGNRSQAVAEVLKEIMSRYSAVLNL